MIDELVKKIRERKNSNPNKSYTSSLLSGGLNKCIDKLEEEFAELKEALNTKNNEVHEAADLLYHLLVYPKIQVFSVFFLKWYQLLMQLFFL